MEQNQSAEAAILTQSPPAPAPAAKPLTLIAQADAEIARLREQRHRLAAQSQEYHAELTSIAQKLREAGVELAEVERLQARQGAIRQASATLGREDQRLEREINLATNRLAALKQQREFYEGLSTNLRAQILTQRQRERDARQEVDLALQLIAQAETQLRGVIDRLKELGEVPAGSRN